MELDGVLSEPGEVLDVENSDPLEFGEVLFEEGEVLDVVSSDLLEPVEVLSVSVGEVLVVESSIALQELVEVLSEVLVKLESSEASQELG